MLKRIKTRQLQVGMFVARVGGPWIEHPFWRSRFLVNSQEQIDQMIASKVEEVWIDLLKGKGIPPPVQLAATGSLSVKPVADEPASAVPQSAVSLEVEFGLAREVMKNGKAVVGSMFTDARMGRALEVEGALMLVDSVSNSLTRHSQALIALARLKVRDDYTYLHSFAVCALMIALGRTLGLDNGEVQQLGLAGLVHDIGKISIPTQVLHKRGDMTAAEMAMVQRHPSVGYRILNEARLYSNIPLDVCVHHHERIDGRGYPFGLHGHEISVHAKIAAVCDTYDSLTSSRPGHQAWTPARALEYMAVRVDTLFDRTVFQAFTRSIGIYPLGTVLRLRSGRLAVVFAQNDNEPLRPRVKVFYSLSEATQVGPETLDLSEAEDTIVSFEDPAQWGFRDEQLLELCAA
ncbi:HD-GYP domain-containing protein [Cupriavidus basilensis]|uniref:HD-GYP domain-containing protein n=1 Tax=Cupriavidus TaxID=106589 RepID=UPI0004461B9D|nr:MULTISPECIES: HD-GYP domain-containing protein [Cupriavidus]KDP86059.1 phosphohydrolase [Cupriavidus sp. SK-3]MDF3881461.1 HD-GYP domain-containing protein [Cupriavidus basilensis]